MDALSVKLGLRTVYERNDKSRLSPSYIYIYKGIIHGTANMGSLAHKMGVCTEDDYIFYSVDPRSGS